MGDRAQIIFMMDGDQSRERLTLITRFLPILKQTHEVRVLESTETEDSLLKILKEKSTSLVVLPWRKYQKWSRIDGFLGLNRTDGPEVCGYLGDPTLPNKLNDFQIKQRLILLDLDGMEPAESAQVLSALAQDTTRSGLKPLVKDLKCIYFQPWTTSERLSNRADSVVYLPEFQHEDSPWKRRENSIRICVQALWGMVFQIGPGQDRIGGTKNEAIAHFHVSADSNLLAMRVIYPMNRTKIKDTVTLFWPSKEDASSPPQLLLRYADLVRVNHITEDDKLEITAVLQQSAPVDRKAAYFHSLWISPLKKSLLSEMDSPPAGAEIFQPLPLPPAVEAQSGPSNKQVADFKRKEQLLETAIGKVKELQAMLGQKEQQIHDLKAGGVGTAEPLPPPDAESLLEAFQERYLDARFKIRRFQEQIERMQSEGTNELKVQQLRRQMLALAQEERESTKTLSEVLKTIKEERKKA